MTRDIVIACLFTQLTACMSEWSEKTIGLHSLIVYEIQYKYYHDEIIKTQSLLANASSDIEKAEIETLLSIYEAKRSDICRTYVETQASLELAELSPNPSN